MIPMGQPGRWSFPLPALPGWPVAFLRRSFLRQLHKGIDKGFNRGPKVGSFVVAERVVYHYRHSQSHKLLDITSQSL